MTDNIVFIHCSREGDRLIKPIPLVDIMPRPLNERLWELHRKSVDRTITAAETLELDVMCAALEAGQDD